MARYPTKDRHVLSPKMFPSTSRGIRIPRTIPEKFNFEEEDKDKRCFESESRKRSLSRWAGIAGFYIIFFTGLSCLFGICMYGLFMTLSPHEPKYQLKDSLIGTNPGLGFRPFPEDLDKSLIWYEASNRSNVFKWTKTLDEFLDDYTSTKEPENKVVCDFDKPPQKGKVCDVNVNEFGPCSREKGYSYNQSAPCVFIKLNRIYNWIPEFYTVEELPKEMDEELVIHIKQTLPAERDVIWISCYGENPADRENIGNIKYYPKRGFPGYYYPYTNTPGYLSPLVAVHFERPALHTLINIECRAWAKNIIYKRGYQHREGSVHFELQID